MTTPIRRVAVTCGRGHVPGLDAVVAGVVRAAHGRGWEVAGIRNGFDGVLCPERYAEGGVLAFDARADEALAASDGNVLGTAALNDPFHMRSIDADGLVEERDGSDALLAALAERGIDAVVAIVGGSAVTGLHALSVAFKLSRKGLRVACVPKSVENEIAGVPQAFGYNSVLAHTVETLQRIRVGVADFGRIAVVEVPGHYAGWLALQSGIATLADAVLIPEIGYDTAKLAAALAAAERAGRAPSLVVVAEGGRPASGAAVAAAGAAAGGLRASLTPNADPDYGDGRHVIDRSGAAAQAVAEALRRLTDHDAQPLALASLVRGGAPTASDRQLGLAYGAAAVRALADGQSGVMVSVRTPDIAVAPLSEALNRVRTIPADSDAVGVARALGIALGD